MKNVLKRRIAEVTTDIKSRLSLSEWKMMMMMMSMLQHIIVSKLINSFCVYTCLVIEATVGKPIIFTSALPMAYSYPPLLG